ncbi:interleukin-1 receptor-associated kinase 4 [Leguminivora glycinivorella]|uniref:interleukin-1 receptor-associated kinase 4 n=1 Tax=Leguminivora glycinivorella TaxID=1035111 RepID=UPI00200CA01D|nr:interleukin-1 receptor-associated kinase 4 [Leguminivora glycinivorella]
MSANTEIRNLKEGTLDTIVKILHIVEDDWKKFMAFIPMDPQKENSDRKYNGEHIRLIEEHSKVVNEKCAKILFDEWGTSGQIRPTLKTVQHIALKAEMMRLADEIADILGEPHPPRPTQGPGAPVTDNITLLLNETSSEIRDTTAQMKSENNETNNDIQGQSTEQVYNMPNFKLIAKSVDTDESYKQESSNQQISEQSNEQVPYLQQLNIQPSGQVDYESEYQQFQTSVPNIPIFLGTTEGLTMSSKIDSSILQDPDLIHFDYEELQTATNNFSDICKVGSGGFGVVFKAPHPGHGLLAVKKTHNQPNQAEVMRTFNSEVRYLSQFRHMNIVPILGFSKNGPVPCIVCEFIEGGSLTEKISAKVLNERQRIAIMQGTAEGLRYLHSNHTGHPTTPSATDPSAQNVSRLHFVHGDVKSANILLTKDFVPKLCDFGLTKPYEETFIMPTTFGTQVYMAPEAMQGTVTPKSDIFSYGIVLLELLTGLKPFVVTDNTKVDIKTYIYEGLSSAKSISDFLDQSTQWTKAGDIFVLVKKCLEYNRHDRPTSEAICNILNTLK